MATKDVPDDEILDDKSRRKLTKGTVIGAPFDAFERLFPAYDGGKIFDSGIDLHETPRKIKEMLRRSGQARQLEQILTLPLRAADIELRPAEGGDMEAALVDENLMQTDMLNQVVDQATAAVAYRHAFFEKEWDVNGSLVTYKALHWRPPASCEVAWDPKTGRQEGFRQRSSGLDSIIMPLAVAAKRGSQPGYVDIPRSRAYIYTHGMHREPVRGLSDMDVAYWAYETQQKLLFLWFQFLEQQSLPKTVTYGDTLPEAEDNADAIAATKASGVIPMKRMSDPTMKNFEILESSGAGAGQFLEAVNWLDGQMTKSVLASFIDLASVTNSTGRGSYALSSDQSEFFLQSRQAVANELANSVQEGVFKPLCVFNFGPDAKIPKLSIGPLSKQHMERSLELLNSVITAETLNVPVGFVGDLIKLTSTYLGLDEGEVRRTVDEYVDRRNKLPLKQELDAESAKAAQEMQKATGATAAMVARAKAGQDPKDAAKAVRGGK